MRVPKFLVGLLTAAIALTLATPLASAEVSSLEVHGYQQDFGVPGHVAREHLETQQEGAGIVEQLERTQSDRYAGVWFDNTSGEFVVPTLRGTSRAAVAASFRASLAGDFRIQPARYSWEELEAAQERINEETLPLIEEGLVQTALDPRTNAVVVEVSSAMSKDDRGRLAGLAASSPTAVEIREMESDRLQVETVACRLTAPRVCDKPLRGGVDISYYTPLMDKMIYANDLCSAGFKATGNAFGNRFVLTAGHCVDNLAHLIWGSETSNGVNHQIGPVEAHTYPGGDWAAIKANGSFWDTSPWPSMVAHYWEGQERQISNEARSYVGQFVCHSGQKSGTSCGNVILMDKTAVDNGLAVYHTTEFGNICVRKGDSGGPVFAGNVALGLMSSADHVTDDGVCDAKGRYIEITEATDALGVTVAPRIVPPASSISLGGSATHCPAESARLLGGAGTAGGPLPSGQVIIPVSRWENNQWVFKRNLQTTISNGSYDFTTSLGAGKWHAKAYLQASGLAQPSESNAVEVTIPSFSADRDEDTRSGGPRAVSDCNGNIHVFYRTPAGGLGHNWYAVGAPSWGSETLWGSVASEPHATVDRNNHVHVFYRKPDNGLGHTWYEVGNTVWGGETLPGTLAANAEPQPVVDTNRNHHVFYRTPSGGLGHSWFQAGTQKWGSEVLAGSLAPNAEPHPLLDRDNNLHVFYRTPSGGLGHNWYAVGAPSWGSETLWGSVASEPHALVTNRNHIHVFYRTPANALGHTWYETGSNTVWGGEIVPGTLGSDAEPRPLATPSHNFHVFYRTPAGGLGHSWYQWGQPNWVAETVWGSPASEPHPILDSTTLHVFYRTSANALGHTWYQAGSPVWGGETLTGSLASEPHPIQDASQHYHVFTRTPTGGVGHNWFQAGSSGPWGWETLTGSVAARKPMVATAGASAITASSAKVQATVTPNGSPTSYYFEYGKTTAYGSKQPLSAKAIGYGHDAATVIETLTGLAASTEYHYRIVAVSPEGTTNGVDKTFKTAAG